MSFSFSIPSKSNANRSKKPSVNLLESDDQTPTTVNASAVNYVREFNPDDVRIPSDSKIRSIAPLPDECRHIKYLKNLPNLSSISQSNGSDSALQFELDPGCNPEASDKSMGYGLNLRQRLEENDGLHDLDKRDNLSDLERRKFKDDLEKLPDGPELSTDYEDVPVEGFGAAIFAGYGWKEGMGIGRNAKEDVKVYEFNKRIGRGGLGFCETEVNLKANENGHVGQDKREDVKERTSFKIGKEMRIVSGRDVGMKGEVVEVRRKEDVLILRLSKSGEKVKVRMEDMAELGSTKEEKCLRRLEESKSKNDRGNKDSNPSRTRNKEESKMVSKRVNWLRNNIKIRIISKELNCGRLFLKKGVVVDVAGPGICDISIDETNELIQGVEQELLETALPRRGGPVLILLGKYKGVCGSLLERDPEKEMCMVRDLNTHEILEVPLDQIAEYTGDPSDVGY